MSVLQSWFLYTHPGKDGPWKKVISASAQQGSKNASNGWKLSLRTCSSSALFCHFILPDDFCIPLGSWLGNIMLLNMNLRFKFPHLNHLNTYSLQKHVNRIFFFFLNFFYSYVHTMFGSLLPSSPLPPPPPPTPSIILNNPKL
jgi:hypothetical protein